MKGIYGLVFTLLLFVTISCQSYLPQTSLTEYKVESTNQEISEEELLVPDVEIDIYKTEIEESESDEETPIPFATKIEPESIDAIIVEHNPYIENPTENYTTPEIISNSNEGTNNNVDTVNPVNVIPLDETPLRFVINEGEILTIPIMGSGWIFEDGLNENGNRAIKEDRIFTGEKTIFTFSFLEPGLYTLSFQSQNLNSGDINKKNAFVEVSGSGNRIDEENIFSNNNSANSYDQFSRQNGNIDDRLDDLSEDEINNLLLSAEQNPDSSYRDRIDILNFLVSSFGTGPKGAEYYYRLALILEQQGHYQDIHQSFDLYNFVSENFPLSMYSRMSKDRIRYLDRHYFRIN